MTDHIHKLDVACLECVRNRLRERDKLLRLVREIASYDLTEKQIEHDAYAIIARDLLKELNLQPGLVK